MSVDISSMTTPQLTEKLRELDKQKVEVLRAIEQRKKQDKKALKQKLRSEAESHGFSWEELFGGEAPKARVGRGGYKSAPKYRNPSNPEQTWTGRGTRPGWYKEALAAGKNPDEMLI